MEERKTALILSGGGSRGAYECGVWQALTELGIKIDIVAGVSVGAINGAMIMQGDVLKTKTLWRQMETDMLFDVEPDAQLSDFAKEFLKEGGAGTEGMQKMMKEYFNEDVIRANPMDFGIVTVEFPSMKPHYVWKEDMPYGMLNDYVTASASAFPAIHTHRIGDKQFIDGGYADNLPVCMAAMKGATHTIAVYLDAVGKFDLDDLKDVPNLTFIRSKWDLGDFLSFRPDKVERILRLGYLDGLKAFGAYDGEYYTFIKGSCDKRQIPHAETAGRVFDLDPLLIYSKEKFMECLEKAIIQTRADTAAAVEAAHAVPTEAMAAVAEKIPEEIKSPSATKLIGAVVEKIPEEIKSPTAGKLIEVVAEKIPEEIKSPTAGRIMNAIPATSRLLVKSFAGGKTTMLEKQAIKKAHPDISKAPAVMTDPVVPMQGTPANQSLSSLTSAASLKYASEILKTVGRKAMTLYIADSIKTKDAKSIFLTKYAFKILGDEITAARFLIKAGLV